MAGQPRDGTAGAVGVSRIGILGGGQLARMMALAGVPLGLEFSVLDPSADACGAAAARLHVGAYDDQAALDRLAGEVGVATFDFENVPGTSARRVASRIPFHPPVSALEACQDRITEKDLLAQLGIAVPDYVAVDSRTDLAAAVERLGFPCVLKTRRLGYDGKGQAVLRQPEDLERAWHRIGGPGLVLEAFVPFEAECSQVAVRGQDGRIEFWPLTRNLHSHGILLLSRNGGLNPALAGQAEETARRLLAHFDYVGVIAIEFFVYRGLLLVNEIAPRVHNSGHWTIDGAVTSQFENHVRAVAGLPLGSARALGEAVMFNWIGELPDRRALLEVPGLHWHAYGKAPRPGRKIGHATLVAPDESTLRSGCERIASLLGGEWPRELEALFSPAMPEPA